MYSASHIGKAVQERLLSKELTRVLADSADIKLAHICILSESEACSDHEESKALYEAKHDLSINSEV